MCCRLIFTRFHNSLFELRKSYRPIITWGFVFNHYTLPNLFATLHDGLVGWRLSQPGFQFFVFLTVCSSTQVSNDEFFDMWIELIHV